MHNILQSFLVATIHWPKKTAMHLTAFAPLIARLVIGEIFVMAGWGKLQNMAVMIENFASWGIPFPEILTPFVATAQVLCGLLLIIGLLTRISAGILGVIMIVAIKSALWEQVDSLDTLLGFSETAYLVICIWLAIAGAGKLSADHFIER